MFAILARTSPLRVAFLFCIKKGEDMDIYNMSHCKDLTAAIAIARVDKPRKAKRPRITWSGLTYQIGDVVRLRFVGGKITAQEARR